MTATVSFARHGSRRRALARILSVWAAFDPTRTICLDQAVFPGSSGIEGSRDWTVPPDMSGGHLWVRLQYWMEGVGPVALSEMAFRAAEPASTPDGADRVRDDPTSVRTSWGRIKERHRL